MTPSFLRIKPAKQTKIAKQILSLALVALLATASIPAGASFALEATKDPDVIVYGILDDSGLLSDVYAVEVTHKNGTALYQQSREEALELPWTFALTYTLDGKAMSPGQLAGKTGKLGIQMTVDQNIKVATDEFKRYALQVVMALPAEGTTNLVAPGAGVAYKGSEQQAIFTLLPGEAHDIALTCDVTDLEMAPILISALPMSLAISLPKTVAAQDQFDTLLDGTQALRDGSKALNKGIEQALGGLNPLEQGASQLSASLGDNSASNQAIKKVQDANQIFLVKAKQEAQQLEQMVAAAQADPTRLGILKGQYQGLMETILLVEANQEVIAQQAKGIQSLSRYVSELAAGLKKAVTAMTQLSQGSQKLATGTAELNTEIQDSKADIDTMLIQLKRLEPITKSSSHAADTASHTQYVIRTGAINLPEVVSIEKKEDTPSLWQRLLLLIGIDA